VYQTTLAPFKISDQEKIWWNNVFSPSAETFDKQQNQKWNLFCVGTTTAKTLELKKIKEH
jgi:uroporphyrinogen-III synthase